MKDAYQCAYFHCKLDGDKVPSAEEDEGWSKQTSAKRAESLTYASRQIDASFALKPGHRFQPF